MKDNRSIKFEIGDSVHVVDGGLKMNGFFWQIFRSVNGEGGRNSYVDILVTIFNSRELFSFAYKYEDLEKHVFWSRVVLTEKIEKIEDDLNCW